MVTEANFGYCPKCRLGFVDVHEERGKTWAACRDCSWVGPPFEVKKDRPTIGPLTNPATESVRKQINELNRKITEGLTITGRCPRCGDMYEGDRPRTCFKCGLPLRNPPWIPSGLAPDTTVTRVSGEQVDVSVVDENTNLRVVEDPPAPRLLSKSGKAWTPFLPDIMDPITTFCVRVEDAAKELAKSTGYRKAGPVVVQQVDGVKAITVTIMLKVGQPDPVKPSDDGGLSSNSNPMDRPKGGTT